MSLTLIYTGFLVACTVEALSTFVASVLTLMGRLVTLALVCAGFIGAVSVGTLSTLFTYTLAYVVALALI